jgi:hypothetical protein
MTRRWLARSALTFAAPPFSAKFAEINVELSKPPRTVSREPPDITRYLFTQSGFYHNQKRIYTI